MFEHKSDHPCNRRDTGSQRLLQALRQELLQHHLEDLSAGESYLAVLDYNWIEYKMSSSSDPMQ